MLKKIFAIGSSFVAGVVISTYFKLYADANSIRVVLIFNDQSDKDLHKEFRKIFNKNRKAFKGLSINAGSTYSYRLNNAIEYRFRISDKDIHLVEKFIEVRD